jgi:hypothetical protein
MHYSQPASRATSAPSCLSLVGVVGQTQDRHIQGMLRGGRTFAGSLPIDGHAVARRFRYHAFDTLLSGRSSIQLQPESRSKFVGESVIRLAYTRFFVQALDEGQSFVLREVREPRPHFASETLGFDRPRFLFFEKHQQPGEVI